LNYKPTFLEVYVSNLLIEKDIRCIWDLNIESLCEAFGITVVYDSIETCLMHNNKFKLVVIDNRLSEAEQYHQFLHELGHYLLSHTSFQLLNENQWRYIELKADMMIQYISMPYFLIDTLIKLETIEAVSEYFFVNYDLAYKRMEKIKCRQLLDIYTY
jgi:Zn-dependent peptidase ImmA (M78 family)